MKYHSNIIKMVWFDLDDTIIDFHANSRAALEKLYAAEGLQTLWPTPGDWIKAYEAHNTRLWALYSAAAVTRDHLRMERFRRPLADAGMPPDEARRLSSIFDTEYLDLLASERRLIPGAIQLLRTLRSRGTTIGILSNGFKEVQHRKIHHAGIAPLIDIVVLSDDIGINKPDTRLFRHAMKMARVDNPKSNLMIGDNLATDIAGALDAGWNAIAFNPSLPLPITPEGKFTIVNDLTLIPDLLSF